MSRSNEAEEVKPQEEGEESLPLMARMLNHILTPGSSLSPVVWISFNVIMLALFVVWLMFVCSMPKNVHVWIFGILGLGLTASTNWLMKIVFSSGLDFASQQQREAEEKSAAEKTVEEKKND
ncbi:hypothetical protein ABB37_08507 [Leptomonas pyrrhocoris]|uniref:Uncharacterized protein n=1 Tax=Leptomonas pyrrhocoris TaxID=157538 RepID=A0A0N0DRV2_LEPPY|nr:hypothetical protein ABB37_08507 [Leptomonas pyrrhocoris]KPA75188.1 hypothetical protein ABB37_08507 [Leptomonas pyrrhocoris]|eukprot:XP_015653627.1 hypothetical protein ABB37_08507 [Leptomonas pyrrhocoris]